MTHPISPRNNFFDGQNISENDLDTEQSAWHDTISSTTELASGSGVEQAFTIQRVLLDTESVPASVESLIDTQGFDGDPVFEKDTLGNTVFLQPSDSTQGNQLDIKIIGSSLDGSAALKVFIFGKIFGGEFVQEVFRFDDNGTKITRNYYTEITAVITQDFRGNQNTLIDGVISRNNGGQLQILEALPMRVARDTIMAKQTEEPNQDYKNFKPATLFKTLDIILDEIATEAEADKDDLGINLVSTKTRNLEPNKTGEIVGEKFKATTNNIQKVTVLLSVKERTLVPTGQEFDWTGDIVLGIRRLQTTTTCPTDIIPNAAIDFDPELSSLAEVSFDKNTLEDLGIVLDDTAQEVDFIFTQSLLANPNVEPSIIPGDFYVLTIRRTGNLSVGTIVLEEAANTNADPNETDEKRMTVFAQNSWTDVTESDLWFEIHTDAVRIVDGTAVDVGVQIRSPKVKKNSITGLEEPFIEGSHSLIDVSSSAENYIITQKTNEFSDPKPSPSTGNLVFTRLSDAAEISVISESSLTTLINGGNDSIVLGVVTDTNPVDNPLITGTTQFPGLQDATQFTIVSPNSDILTNNLIGSVLIPNTDSPSIKYRIIKKEVFTDLFGDINGDGVIDLADVTRGQEIGNVVSGDGYSKDLQSGLVPSATQISAVITNKTVTIEEILRGDVNGNSVVSLTDVSLIQQNITLGTAFSVGASFTRVVLTVENLTSPLSTTPDIVGSDTAFNTVPFVDVSFRIDFVPLWTEDNLIITDLRRFITKTFTSIESTDITGSPKNGGKNTFFIPSDVLIGGNILDSDGNIHPLDLEVSNVILELPDGYTQGEIDVFNSFIKNTMKFSDGTSVPLAALAADQVRVTAAIQSHVKDLDGYDFQSIDGYAAIEETVATLYTQSTGILRIRAANIRNVPTRPELSTKIVLTVYLKKAGFQNTDQVIIADDISDFLTPI